MAESNLGCGVVAIVGLAAVVWVGAVLITPHYKMSDTEASKLTDTTKIVKEELGLHFGTSNDVILLPRQDDGLDIFLKRTDFESVPYPDRPDAVASTVSQWCAHASAVLLPGVRFRDIHTGEALSDTSCVYSNFEPDKSGFYQGIVENKTAQLTSQLYLVVVEPDDLHHFNGCIQVTPPLYGTGRVQGTFGKDGTVEFRLNQSNMSIVFRGKASGDRISGKYSVNNDSQLGEFSIHKYETMRFKAPNFSFETCE